MKDYRKVWAAEENKRSQFNLVFRNQKWDDALWDQKCRFIKDSCQQWNLFMPIWYRKHFYLCVSLFSDMKHILACIVNIWSVTFKGLRNHLRRTIHVQGLVLRTVYGEERLVKGKACYILFYFMYWKAFKCKFLFWLAPIGTWYIVCFTSGQ